jgi:hypothetical protein
MPEAAQFMTAPVPEHVAFHEYSLGTCIGGARRLGKGTCREALLSRFGSNFYQTGVRAEKRVTFSVRLDALGPTDSFEVALEFLEAVALQMVKPNRASHQKRSVGSISKRRCRASRNSLCQPKGLEAIAIESVYAVLRTDPEKFDAILVDLEHTQVVQSLCGTEAAKTILLRAQCPGRQQHEGESRRVFLPAHRYAYRRSYRFKSTKHREVGNYPATEKVDTRQGDITMATCGLSR